jgi:hypothetical protein
VPLTNDTRRTGGNNHHGSSPHKVSAEMPPHDAAAEFSLIAAEYLSPGSLAEIGADRDWFYVARHRELYDIAGILRETGETPSIALLRHFLLQSGNETLFSNLGGSALFDELEVEINAPHYLRYYGDKNREAVVRRRLIHQAASLCQMARDPSIDAATLLSGADLSKIADPTGRAINWLSAADFDDATYQDDYLVPHVLAAGQPGGIFGAFNVLKTSVKMDLALSVATGSRFLGYFPVTRPAPTAVMSGESGLKNLQSLARRICSSKGWSLGSVEGFHITSVLPRLDDPACMAMVRKFIKDNGIKLLMIDPAYLCMDIGDEANNLFLVGKFLRPIAEICAETGCTILVLHHNKRNVTDKSAPAELADISWSGFAEFSAQWILLSRRTPFDAETGLHSLWLNVGGRDGHAGLYGVDITEGHQCDQGGRRWDVVVKPASEARAATVDARETQREQKQTLTAQRDRQSVLEVLQRFPNGETGRTLRESSRLSGTRFTPIITELESEGRVVACTVTKAKGTYDGYRLTTDGGTRWDKGGTTDAFPLSQDDGGTRDSYRESQSHHLIFDGEQTQDTPNRESVPLSHDHQREVDGEDRA